MDDMFTKGDKVIIKALGNQLGIIDGQPKRQQGKLFYPVSLDPNKESSYYPSDALQKYILPKSVEQLLTDKQFSNVHDFKEALIYNKLDRPLANNLYTFHASRTEFQVHQFKPVLKFLSTLKQRLLLADEVGLGKTIEAGIIITELSSRLGELSRVLVVCPSMLTPKWETELQKRFALDFDVLQRADFNKFLEKYAEYGEAEKIMGIISLQTLRANKMIQNLREVSPHFDIVIVDEAHYMRNPETLSSELGEALSELSDAMLFLSATPLQLGTPDLFNLLGLLIPEEFSDFLLFHNLIEPNEYINTTLRRLYEPSNALKTLKKVENTTQRERFLNNPFYLEALDLLSKTNKLSKEQAIKLQKLLIELNCLSYVFTRTKKRDVATEFPVREARVIRVEFTKEEMDFYNGVTEFVSDHFTAKYQTTKGISFAVIMPQRQVSSCIQAMKGNLYKILKKKAIHIGSLEDCDVIDTSLDSDLSWKLDDRHLASIRNLQEVAKRVGDYDTKFDQFIISLRNLEDEDPDAKIIVFAFFKPTLEYLKRRLDTTEYRNKSALIHGDVPKKERHKILNKFRNTDQIKILLSSEVSAEGLDLEFCKVVFNYDLPWNPMRIEQRIGRLDRYGQRHEKILIYNFSIAGTIDDEILNRLYRRINIFEKYIGDLDAILGEQITELTREMFNAKLTQEQKIQMIEKIAENMERRQKDLEEFEENCQKFIGQDEYFNQEITRIKDTRRFITSEEVMFLLKNFLIKNFPKTMLKPPKSNRSNVFVFQCDDEFAKFVRQYSPNSEQLSKIEKKISYDGGFLATFNDQEACKDESLEFITIHHPIMKSIKRYYDENRQESYHTAQFQLNGNGNYKGRYLFFIYLLEKRALKTDFILVPILVNPVNSKVEVENELCDWFVAEIVNAETIENDNIADYDKANFTKSLREAGDYLEMIREGEENNLRKINNTLVSNQIESVRQATTIKIDKAYAIIQKLISQDKSEDDPIIRLHKGRIRKLDAAMEKKMYELEDKRHVAVSFNLIAGGVVQII